MNKRRIWRWTKIVLLLYGVVGIVLYHTQDYFLWHPDAVPPSTIYTFSGQPHSELNIPFDKETNLNVVQFRATDRTPDSAAKGVVLYFHGNGGNIGKYSAAATDFTRHGYECWIWDYPGFGKSTGDRSEQKLYVYALTFYKLARSRWPPSAIILYGRSIGTGIAAQLADIRDCRRLILESPYYSIESLASRYLPVYPWSRMLHYHFPLYAHLQAVTAPITIFHGTDDRTVPYGNASRLKALLKNGDEFITVEGAGHNNLHDYAAFRQKLDSLLRN